MISRPRKLGTRKLLVASVGVAAVAFAACSNTTVGNLMAVEAGPAPDAGKDAALEFDVSADAPADVATEASGDAAADAGGD